ncbi:MAG: hypothetical protein RIT43_2077 [Bacteroidota bacterium]|jgi:ketol-acid reductoisomerase
MKAVSFYSEIGKLLYAVTVIDHKIDLRERKRVHELIQDVIKKTHIRDQFGTPVANYIEIEFEFLEEQIYEAEDALQSFLDYIEEHYSAIGKDDIEMIRKLVWETADCVRGINTAEQTVIEKMEHAFSQIKNKHKELLERHENKKENQGDRAIKGNTHVAKIAPRTQTTRRRSSKP